jgi:ribosomal-protein-alanine N-acetyltransferase
MGIEVLTRQGQVHDVETLVEISDQNFEKPWNREHLLAELSGQGRIVWVAGKETRVVGYLVARLVLDVLEVLSLAVRRSERRLGPGSRLIGRALKPEVAWSVVQLEVREDNVGALNFYHSLNFEEVGRRRLYYSGKTDALLLSLDMSRKAFKGSRIENFA